MHGRLKVKTTAEQQEAKRKEREKKLKLYTAATSKIFAKKTAGELDEELLHLTGEVLTVNPDFYTLWNYRKEAFIHLKQSKPEEELQKLFVSELYFLESCLKVNPKSYGTWHHRCFVMDTMPEPDWAREMELCNQFLKFDERNFHCWDYRRYIVKRAKISSEAELDYSFSKISNNFSNYSSWHYRSKLLPLIYPDGTQPMAVREDILLKEYELVQNGLFTDPDDQSNWFYHRWLMGRGEQKQRINSISLSLDHHTVTVSLLKHIQIGKDCKIELQLNGEVLDGVVWLNQDNQTDFSTLWIGKSSDLTTICDNVLEVTLYDKEGEVCSSSLKFNADMTEPSIRWIPPGSVSRFSQEASAVKSEVLQQELESMMQLVEVDSDNKWAVLTMIMLMRAVDSIRYASEIHHNLDQLQALDFKRAEYYKDLRSKFVMEDAIDAMDKEEKLHASPSSTTLCLKNKSLTRFYHTELLTLVTVADFSNNQLRNVQACSLMVNLRELRLSNNQITTCRGLGNLPLIEKIYLNNNSLNSPESLTYICSCSQLKLIDLSGNPLLEVDMGIDTVRQMFPEVDIVTETTR